MTTDPNRFYVYAYLRNVDSKHGRKNTPYYIGKGSGKRAHKSARRSCSVPLNQEYIVFVQEGLTEEQAFSLERYCISMYGRIDNGTGILHNLTDGGEGCAGMSKTEATRRKIAEIRTGQKHSETTKQKISKNRKGKTAGSNNPQWGKRGELSAAWGRECSNETRLKISQANKGKKKGKQSAATIAKKRAARVYNLYELIDPNEDVYMTESLQEFACQHQLTPSSLYKVVNGQISHHRGWKVRIAERLR